jgi:holliday junction DNA helicase RuvA
LPDVVRTAIASGDVSTLTRVPGIGKKGAERIILELRDKVGPIVPGSLPTGVPRQMAWQDQVRQGLVGLGWTAGQADQAISVVAEGIDGTTPAVPELLRQAIKVLGRVR